MNPELTGVETVRRIETALSSARESRLRHVAALPGNPLGVEQRHWPMLRATLVRAPVLYYGYFNEIHHIDNAPESEVAEALNWFRSNRAVCRVRVGPGPAGEHLRSQLVEHGLVEVGALSVLFAREAAPTGLGTSVVTVDLQEAGANDDFARLWLPEGADDSRLAELGVTEFLEWRRYVAYVDGQPAAMACLYLQGQTAVLASAWTITSMRRLGCQAALIACRIADAFAAGCDLVVSEAEPESASRRNLERAGMRLVNTQSIYEDRATARRGSPSP